MIGLSEIRRTRKGPPKRREEFRERRVLGGQGEDQKAVWLRNPIGGGGLFQSVRAKR